MALHVAHITNDLQHTLQSPGSAIDSLRGVLSMSPLKNDAKHRCYISTICISNTADKCTSSLPWQREQLDVGHLPGVGECSTYHLARQFATGKQ